MSQASGGEPSAESRGKPPAPRRISIGGGRLVLYPEATSVAASNTGRANRRTGTQPELRLRSALHRRGLRFRKDHSVRAFGVRVRPDIVFTRWHVAVFVDGCFWHGCPEHGHVPKSNLEYWIPKLAGNVDRDRRVDAALHDAGWTVLRVWEHTGIEEAVSRIEDALAIRRSQDRYSNGVPTSRATDPVAGAGVRPASQGAERRSQLP